MTGTGGSQHSIGEWRDETVYAAWKNSTGHCDGCPNRQFRDECHPQFGAGDGDADIMIVGHAPGKGSGGQRQATAQADDPTYTPPETYEEFGYTAAQLDAWRFTNKLQANLFTPDDRIATGFDETYYTNLLKCHAIENGDNSHGRQTCSNYFVDEIDIVDPSVILGFGKGVPEIATRLNITLRGDGPKEYCRPRPESPFKIAHYTDDQGRVLIPAPHFNYIGTTVKRYDWWDESPPGKSFYAAIREITNQNHPTPL